MKHVGRLNRLNTVGKVDRRIRCHYTTTIIRLRIGARLTRYRNCKFHNFARTISRHADGISRYSVSPSAGPLLPLVKQSITITVSVSVCLSASISPEPRIRSAPIFVHVTHARGSVLL